MDLSPASACCAIVVMALNGEYGRLRRWAQIAIILASEMGFVVSLTDRAWWFSAAYVIAGWTGVRRLTRVIQ